MRGPYPGGGRRAGSPRASAAVTRRPCERERSRRTLRRSSRSGAAGELGAEPGGAEPGRVARRPAAPAGPQAALEREQGRRPAPSGSGPPRPRPRAPRAWIRSFSWGRSARKPRRRTVAAAAAIRARPRRIAEHDGAARATPPLPRRCRWAPEPSSTSGSRSGRAAPHVRRAGVAAPAKLRDCEVAGEAAGVGSNGTHPMPGEVDLDPGVRVGVADDEHAVLVQVRRAGAEAGDDAGRDAGHPEQQRHRPGELLAVPGALSRAGTSAGAGRSAAGSSE